MTRPPVLFAAAGVHARELDADEVSTVQAFLDANPEYWLAVNGTRPPAELAQIEFDERPPPHLPYDCNRFCGLFDEERRLVGLVVFVEGFMAPAVVHLALFMISTALRGSGLAQRAYDAMERWMRDRGHRWLRLGVIAGNEQAERFWARQGFRQLRRRDGVDTGGRLNTVLVMLKPLEVDAAVDTYLALCPRDRPDSTRP